MIEQEQIFVGARFQNDSGTMRIMAEAEKYLMVRKRATMPFVIAKGNFSKYCEKWGYKFNTQSINAKATVNPEVQ